MAKNGPEYNPKNPHPLSQMKTELVWEGTYDVYGNRREVDVAGLAMPMQKIETIDEPRSEVAAAGQLELFEKKTKKTLVFKNDISPLRLLRSCLDFALNRHEKVGGVFATIAAEFIGAWNLPALRRDLQQASGNRK